MRLLLPETIDSLSNALEDDINQLTEHSVSLRNVIDSEYDHPGTVTSNWKKLQEELTNRLQYVLFARQIHQEAQEAKQSALKVINDLSNTLNGLQAIVGTRSSVPKEEVFVRNYILTNKCFALFYHLYSIFVCICLYLFYLFILNFIISCIKKIA